MGLENSVGKKYEQIEVSRFLPEIGRHIKFVEAASREDYFPKDDLDALYVWWAESVRIDAVTDRFARAVAAVELPELERKQASEILEERKSQITAIYEGIVNYVGSPKPKWEDAKPIMRGIGDLERSEREPTDGQVIALCEAITESQTASEEPEDPKILRRKVAQFAWKELLNSFQYAILYSDAGVRKSTTTIDGLEREKENIRYALLGDLWDEGKIKKQRTEYRRWGSYIRRNYPDAIGKDLRLLCDAIGKDLRLLWTCVRGKMSGKVSGIDILRTQERILRKLARERAFR
jgi:hypothetical protein